MTDPSVISVRGVRDGGIARIILDRPRALNALTLSMVHDVHDLLEGWRLEPLRAVIIESSTPGIFCAGGDIRQIRQNTLDDDFGSSDEFFRIEYAVNEMLASYPTPVVALIDGVCMGGGLGMSVHGPFRVVTERAVLAMPETSIGFFPDIGASYFLSRLPGGVGTWLGLTGSRIGPAEALDIGLATHYVASDDLISLATRLAAEDGSIDAILRDLTATPAESSWISPLRDSIDAAFTASTVDAIADRLTLDGTEWSIQVRDVLAGLSPQSLHLTLDLILWGKQRSLRECLDAELQAAGHVIRSPDFIEGVRAALVDKDRAPSWGATQYVGTSSQGAGLWQR